MQPSSWHRLLLLVLLALPAGPAAAGPSRPATSNGRQVVRAGDRWFAAYADPSGQRAYLATTKGRPSGPMMTDGWEEVLFLSPDGKGVFRTESPALVPPSLAAD